jgi:hypothetical protein
MGPKIEKLWMLGLQKWRIIFMLPKLGDIRPWNLPNPTKRLCFNMVEDNEAKGKENPWLYMGILQRTY